MNDVGAFALQLALVVAAYSTITTFAGMWRRRPELAASAENGTFVTFGLLTVAAAALIRAFVTHDFGLESVAHYSSRDLPSFYAIPAFWAGQSGSLLLWGWLLALFSSIVVLQNRSKNRLLMPAVVGVLSGIELLFMVMMVFLSSPFHRLAVTPADGQGLNPMLQNPGMIFHPPMLYLGYVGFSVPFAFAMAALLAGRLDEGWIRTTRRWTLFSWFALTLGNLFGAQWAYVELGWGGYWAWDPVENASLMPWLTGTAFLHSVMIQEKRGMLKIWNLALIVLTFALTIFGTFITRSGIIASVHSFGVSSLGPVFLVFLGTTVGFAVWMIGKRRKMLRSRNQLDSFLSREAGFLFNNLILVGMAFATFWGTVFPMVSEAMTGNKITVGPPFFNEVNLPIGLALLMLTGVGPLLAWRRSTGGSLRRNFLVPGGIGFLTGAGLLLLGVRDGYAVLAFPLAAFVLTTVVLEFYRGTRVRGRAMGVNPFRALIDLVARNKRRYGGYMVHVGVVLVFAGIAGSTFNRRVNATLNPGESATIGKYTLTYERPAAFRKRNKSVISTELTVYREGRRVGRLAPEKAFYPKFDQPVSEVAIRSSFWEDLYVVLAGVDKEGRGIFQIFVNPLVGWIWAGGWVMALGTMVAIWPDRRSGRRPGRALRPKRTRRISPATVATASVLALLLWAGTATATVDEVASRLACMCGCGMTAGNCTHEGCESAAAIKREVGRMLREGRSQDEILAAFAAHFGDRALAAPPGRGFSLTAWVLPFAAIGIAGLGLYGTLRRWTSPGRRPAGKRGRPVNRKYSAQLARELEEFE